MVVQNLTSQPLWYTKDSYLRCVWMKIPLHSGAAALMWRTQFLESSCVTQGDWEQRECWVWSSVELWHCSWAVRVSADSVVIWHSRRKAQWGLWLAVQVYSGSSFRALLLMVQFHPWSLCFRLQRWFVNNKKLQLTLSLLLSQYLGCEKPLALLS